MYLHSHKVNRRRHLRQIKRQSIRRISTPDSCASDDNSNSDNSDEFLETILVIPGHFSQYSHPPYCHH